jgi:hypothetical protein
VGVGVGDLRCAVAAHGSCVAAGNRGGAGLDSAVGRWALHFLPVPAAATCRMPPIIDRISWLGRRGWAPRKAPQRGGRPGDA